ncbi:hypothetical protein [Rickettsiella endosymbiont of Rhagonycha lignosa]|uniref:hypothetical protein n=1 Tax=Rickettsiella endosymbiont of Rhagonycha lignosa TaxID=3077937 RepID=UPI00313D1B8B
MRIIKTGTDDQLIEIYALVIEADKYKNALNLFNNKIHLLNKSSAKILRAKKNPRAKFKETNFVIAVNEIENLHFVEPEGATEKLISMDSLNEENIQSINPSISGEDSDIVDLEKINQKNLLLDNTTNVNHLPSSLYSENDNKNLITDLEEWKNNFEAWKYEKKIQLYKLFNIIENSTLSILQNGAPAFLKILTYYHQEIIGKKFDLTRLKDKKCFLNSDTIAKLREFLIANEQWLDETLNRMNACIGRVHQSIHNNENLIEISLHALLTEYFKISLSYNNSLKNLMNEEEKLSRFHMNFTKQILPASSLKQMEETINMPDFSKQVDKVNQLKVAMGLEYENKQKIIDKLGIIAPDWLNYVKLIDPLYEDNIAESVISPEPSIIQAANVVPLEVASYGPSKVHISTPPAFYYLLPSPAVYVSDVMVQPGVQPNNQIFYSM